MIDLAEPGPKEAGPPAAAPAPKPPAPQAPPEEPQPPAEVVKKTAEPAPAPAPKPKPKPKPEPKPKPKPEPKPPPAEAKAIPVKPVEPPPPQEPSTEFTEEKVAKKIATMREKLGQPEAPAQPAPSPPSGERVRGAIESIRSRLTPAKTPPRGSPGGGAGSGAVGVRGGSNVLQQVRLRSYYNRLWEHVHEHWTIPPSLQGRDYTVIVSVAIDRGGRVLKSWVEESSGSDPFDQSALRALQRAQPLPPVPDEVPDDTLEVGFRFHGE